MDRSKPRISSLCGLLLTTGLALLLVAALCNLRTNGLAAEARYLPTRSDHQFEVEALKNIIRNLLLEASPSPAARQQRSHMLAQQAQKLKQQQQPQVGYLQRRALELSVSSSNGDDSEGFLMGPNEIPPSVQLFKLANSKPDR